MYEKWKDRLTIETFKDYSEAAEKTIHFLHQGNIALSGGSTYASLYPYWGKLKPDCSQVRFFPADERQVPMKDPASNWRMVYEKLLIATKRVSDVAHHASTPAAYKKILNSYFLGFLPVFDVIFLGMGEDGHTASLFPGGDYLDDDIETVLETDAPSPPVKRISLSPLVIHSAHQVVVVIAGEYKAWALKQVLEGNQEIPLTRVLQQRDKTLFFVQEDLWKTTGEK
ncbi:MAG: 6-phosphogluconolactonase [Spirochaetales bacterium]|nr:6-phosphogluconolactonase [Spirochaetales bacterium]